MVMKKFAVLIVLLLAIPIFQGLANSEKDSYILITQPDGGLYFYGRKIIPAYTPSWTVMVGYNSIEVNTVSSSNVLTAYFTLYNLFTRETVDSVLDATPSDGFTCNFSDVQKGSYIIVVVALALDPNEPVASDWRAPIIFLPA